MSESTQTASIWGWRGAASGVVHRLKQLLDTGERSDVQFAVGREHGLEQLFRAHKLVLGSGSDVFDRMLSGEVPETTEKAIQVPDILPQAFALMLKYLYTDVVGDLSVENVLSTMYSAETYGIPKLFDICVEYATKNVGNSTCLTMLEAVLDAEKLLTRCLEIVDIHCPALLQSLPVEGFVQLKKEPLREVFSRDTLIVEEEQVYKAAQRWAGNACRSQQLEPTGANYRFVLGEILCLVRFPLMDNEQLVNDPLATGLLLNEELLKIYQFKYAAKKPLIPFLGNPRSSYIGFRDRGWQIWDRCHMIALRRLDFRIYCSPTVPEFLCFIVLHWIAVVFIVFLTVWATDPRLSGGRNPAGPHIVSEETHSFVPQCPLMFAEHVANLRLLWIILDQPDASRNMTTTRNVFLDEHGHLHLRISQYNGVWQGAAVRLRDALGVGRYEFHVEGMDRLEHGAGFVLTLGREAAYRPAFTITSGRVRVPDGEEYSAVHFSVGWLKAHSVGSAKVAERKGYDLSTHSFHWRPDGVSLSSHRYHHRNTEGELSSWSYKPRANIPETALPVYISLLASGVHKPVYDGQEVEIVVSSFRFYPGE